MDSGPVPKVSADEAEGMQFGPYLLRQRLGIGGMASVWKALDEAGRTVVVKRMLPSLAEDSEFVAMFQREAALTARMRHPNIVRVFDYGDYEGEQYLTMEYLHGQDLGSLMSAIAPAGPPPPGFGAYVVLEMCRALEYAHGLKDDHGAPLNLIHRDVSLSNVMLGFDGSVKLLDFGVAKALADQRAGGTQAGILKGKWAYVAPEQIECAPIDQRVDQFATGVVLWELLTGRRLFKASSGLETLEKVRAAKVRPPSSVNPAVPEELDAVCKRALQRQPADRFKSAAEMVAALEPVVKRLGFGAADLGRMLTQKFAEQAAAYHAAQRATPPMVKLPRVDDEEETTTERRAPLQAMRRRRRRRWWGKWKWAVVAVAVAGAVAAGMAVGRLVLSSDPDDGRGATHAR
jgi:eukaryotic-like serine/threonine-protein kinase